MFASDRLRSIVRGFRTRAKDGEIDPIASTKRMIELSDEIAAIYKRMSERSKSGAPELSADRERLEFLMKELRANPSGSDRSVQQA